MRQVNASSNFTAEKIPGAVRFEHVEQDMLIERLLGSDSADDFFRQPPFSLTEHVSMATVDAAFKRAGRLVHPDRCSHPNATEAFQRLAHFRAAAVARRDVRPFTRHKCEECGTVPDRPGALFACVGCGRKACHSCNFGLIDKTSSGPSGDRYCFTCVWLAEDGIVYGAEQVTK